MRVKTITKYIKTNSKDHIQSLKEETSEKLAKERLDLLKFEAETNGNEEMVFLIEQAEKVKRLESELENMKELYKAYKSKYEWALNQIDK